MRKALGEFMGDCKLEISERIKLEFVSGEVSPFSSSLGNAIFGFHEFKLIDGKAGI